GPWGLLPNWHPGAASRAARRSVPAQARRGRRRGFPRCRWSSSATSAGAWRSRTSRGPSPARRGLVVEIPQRMNGGRTMPWADLEALSMRARDVGARLHMDGARLWEAQPYYGRSLADICRLFDSVYVSFYKGLGGTCGAMLCGESSLVGIARAWLVRLGGSMFTLAPHWLDAQMQLRAHRGGFEARFEKLREVVQALSGDALVSKILRFEPPIPQSCLVHGYIASEAPRDVVEAAHERVASATGSRLWNSLRGAGYGGDGASSTEAYFEWNMGPANSAITTDAFLEGWRALSRELSPCA
ncbi:unnamed protein product, partial [Prorocentrum cordatum]